MVISGRRVKGGDNFKCPKCDLICRWAHRFVNALKCYAEHGLELGESRKPVGGDIPDGVVRVCGTDSDIRSDDENGVSEDSDEE